MLAVDLGSFAFNKAVIDRCLEAGVITDWFLFNDRSMRLAPPLTISLQELKEALDVVLEGIEFEYQQASS
jgi:4-aminobutyrate aminotransferase-like enzyme